MERYCAFALRARRSVSIQKGKTCNVRLMANLAMQEQRAQAQRHPPRLRSWKCQKVLIAVTAAAARQAATLLEAVPGSVVRGRRVRLGAATRRRFQAQSPRWRLRWTPVGKCASLDVHRLRQFMCAGNPRGRRGNTLFRVREISRGHYESGG